MTNKQSRCKLLKVDDSTGEFEAVFSTFGVVDSDGDVLTKEAFNGSGPCLISAFNHQSWKDKLPIGEGTISVDDDKATVKGRFFLKTADGHDTYHTVKELSKVGLQEWSYSLQGIKGQVKDVDGQRARVITGMDPVTEISPVIKGASVGTHTVSIKQQKRMLSDLRRALVTAGREHFEDEGVYVWMVDADLEDATAVYSVEDSDGERMVQMSYEDDGSTVTLVGDETEVEQVTSFEAKRFIDHASAVLANVAELNTRASEVVTLRATKGKSISADSAEILVEIKAELAQLDQLLTPETGDEATASESHSKDLLAQYLRTQAINFDLSEGDDQ